jgi:hypothetical protein
MRLILGLMLVGSVSLVACSGDDGGGIQRGNGKGTTAPGGDSAGGGIGGSGAPVVAPVTCPAGVGEAKSIAQDTDAADVRVVNANVVYRQGPTVFKVDPKTGVRTQLYTSPDLVRSFIDETVLVTIESPNPPDAVIKVMPAGPSTDQLDPAPLTVTPATWNAAGSYIFASDPTSLYAMADTTTGDTIYKISKADPNAMTVLANLEAASLADAQLVGSDVWFVREQKRVYKIAQDAPVDPANPLEIPGVASPPTEVFSMENANCQLAVGGSSTFCSTGKALEQRDMKGANLRTVFDPAKAAAPSLLGSAIYGTDTVFVRSLPQGTTDLLKNGIRSIKMNGTVAEEKFVACGRETITSFAVDSTMVAWTEKGKGVFTAPR